MTLVLGLMAGIWGLGSVMGAPRRQRWGMIAAVWVGVLGLLLALPVGHPVRAFLGGDARVWLVLSGIVAVGFGYFVGLKRLKAKKNPVVSPATFQPAELDRYARHIMLREIGGPGQKRLKSAKILVVGAGGLGSPVLLYLAAAGVGCIGVIDDDTVDASNLQRQIIHADQRVGMPKVQSAQIAVQALNPHVTLLPYQRRLTEDNAADLMGDYDLILDGSDNFDTRYLINRVAAHLGKPLISGAITQWEGQVSLYDPVRGTPCYECIFPHRPAPGMVPTCAEAGVAAALPGVIGAMMAMEAIKHICEAGQGLGGRLLIHDALFAETRVISIEKRADCAVCGSGAAELTGP